jgi:hypothetical protein
MKKLLTILGLAGALVTAHAGGVYVSASVPLYSYSYWDSPYGYAYYPAYDYPGYPGYYYEYTRPNYAVGGTLLGALTGGLIGASQHHGWEGAGIGAAAGLVLGSVAEIAAEKHEEKMVYATVPPPLPPPPVPVMVMQPAVVVAAPAPAPTPVYPQVYISPNQIPDAPRVPDAPTF